jgi:hypothetical protein
MVPGNSFVIIDITRADFIDKDILEVIEDFCLHAPLKDIRVQIKYKPTRRFGFSSLILNDHSPEPDLIRKADKIIVKEEAL